MAFPNKINTPIAITDHSKINLSGNHSTTSDWLQFNVSKYLPLVPKQTVDIQHFCFQRLAPMPVPTFGRGKIIHRAYFVPYRTVWLAWDAFYNSTPYAFDNGQFVIPTNARYVLSSTLVKLFVNHDEFATPVGANDAYDFEYNQLSDDLSVENTTRYVFTALGRYAYKLLRSLGYNFTFANIDGEVSKPIQAMKLLCVAKAYLDFFYPKQYANTDDAIWLESLFNNNNISSFNEETLDESSLVRLIRCISRVPYSSDYFTSAWDNPVAPNNGTYGSVVINDIGNTGNSPYDSHVVVKSTGGISSQEPVLLGGNGDVTQQLSSLSKYSLTSLNRLTDYVKRMQLVGSRILDRFFARFGIRLSSESLRRSVRIAEYEDAINFADVTSMASTEGASLGDYAGKGISVGNGGFKYTATEHGILLIISINVPEISYYQGMHRDSYHISRLDFWNPEFDGLGVQAISQSELYTPIDGSELSSIGNANLHESVFGFTPRYAEYKIGYSQVTGDLLLRSKNVGNESWTLARDVKPFVTASNDGEHDLNFVMSDDKAQYNRIFNNTTDSADHFHVIHDFNIVSVFPGKRLFDEYEFEDEDKAEKVPVQLSGTVDVN